MFEGASLKRIADRVTKVVTVSDYLRGLLKKIYNIDALVIRHGVDTNIFYPPTPSARDKIRSHLQIPQNRRIVLFVGRLHPYKDPMTLIRSIPRVVEKNPDAYFVIIGDGPSRYSVRSEIARKGLGRWLTVIPRLPLSKLLEWYQVSDLFVSTSPGETLGFTVLEAMSSGVPVLAAVSGGPAEVLGSTGTFFTPKNHENLAQRIRDGLSDGRSAAENGARERET